MIAFGHNVFAPFLEKTQENKNNNLPILTSVEVPNKFKPLTHTRIFEQNQGRDVLLSTSFSFDENVTNQEWIFEVKEVVSFYWVCGSDTINFYVDKEGSPTLNSPPFGKGGILRNNYFTDFIGFDHVFECTGMPEVWESSINYVRRGGTVVLFGGCKSGTTVTYDTGRIHYDEITLRGVFHFTPSDVKKAYKLLSKGTLGVSRLVSGRYPLNKIQKAFDKLAHGEGIKYAIIP